MLLLPNREVPYICLNLLRPCLSWISFTLSRLSTDFGKVEKSPSYYSCGFANGSMIIFRGFWGGCGASFMMYFLNELGPLLDVLGLY